MFNAISTMWAVIEKFFNGTNRLMDGYLAMADYLAKSAEDMVAEEEAKKAALKAEQTPSEKAEA